MDCGWVAVLCRPRKVRACAVKAVDFAVFRCSELAVGRNKKVKKLKNCEDEDIAAVCHSDR